MFSLKLQLFQIEHDVIVHLWLNNCHVGHYSKDKKNDTAVATE